MPALFPTPTKLPKLIRGRDQTHTPLNDPLYEVLMQVANEPSLKWSAKIKALPERRARDKYCDFHQDHGHTTEACYELIQQIELPFSQGKLRQFIMDNETFQLQRQHQGGNNVTPPPSGGQAESASSSTTGRSPYYSYNCWGSISRRSQFRGKKGLCTGSLSTLNMLS